MWTSFNGKHVFMPTGMELRREAVSLVFLGIEDEVAWNPFGRKLPAVGEWVWGPIDVEKWINYLDSLWGQGFVPILWSASPKLKDVVDQMEQFFTGERKKLPAFVGFSPQEVYDWVVGHMSSPPEATKALAPPLGKGPYGITITAEAQGSPSMIPVYSVNSFNNYQIMRTKAHHKIALADLTFDPLAHVPGLTTKISPYLLILMGQQGSGKSTLANRLRSLNWLVYEEKEAGMIRRRQVRITNSFRLSLEQLKRGELKGIVIDATNPTREDRAIYINLAKTAGVPYHVGWVTRPGFVSNKQRTQPVPEIALYVYAKKLETPQVDENPVRLL